MSTELTDKQIIDEARKHATAHVRDSVLTAFARAVIAADRALRPSGGAKTIAVALRRLASSYRDLSDHEIYQEPTWLRDALHEAESIDLDVHQVSAPVEISSCATCGHPVESGGERPAAANGIDTGDHVHHAPSGEDWVVAYVRGDRLVCCGWPESMAALTDCTLTKKATQGERVMLLLQMKDIGGSRAAYAIERLARLAAPGSQESGSTECKESSPLSPASKGIDHE